MEKPKPDPVIAAMRQRLAANRQGRLSPAQWFDISTDPLIVMLLLLAPILVVFSARAVTLFVRGGWVVILAVLLVPLVLRARHYARLPVRYLVLEASKQSWGRLRFWRGHFHTADGRTVRFQRSLAPAFPVEAGRRYIVYFLEEHDRRLLLSIAPEDHVDAALWQPTKSFQWRYEKRTQA